MMHIAAIMIPCLMWVALSGGSIVLAARLLTAPSPPPFAVRVAQELGNPDEDLREALREVDRIGYHAPPVAVPEPAAQTLLAGNSVWRGPGAGAAQEKAAGEVAAAQMNGLRNAGRQSVEQQLLARNIAGMSPVAALTRGPALFDDNREVHPREWFWPYVDADLGAGMFLLRERFGRARVSLEWLELHRHDIVQALRRL